MKATCWYGKRSVKVKDVPEPSILNSRDAIVRVTATAICGSDLHLYGGFVPGMEKGDVMGHEFMGEVVEVGQEVKNLKAGDRVVVPFAIACGRSLDAALFLLAWIRRPRLRAQRICSMASLPET